MRESLLGHSSEIGWWLLASFWPMMITYDKLFRRETKARYANVVFQEAYRSSHSRNPPAGAVRLHHDTRILPRRHAP